MVYYTKTFQLLHKLTPSAKQQWQDMLEREADKILFKHQHPIKWLWLKIAGKLD